MLLRSLPLPLGFEDMAGLDHKSWMRRSGSKVTLSSWKEEKRSLSAKDQLYGVLQNSLCILYYVYKVRRIVAAVFHEMRFGKLRLSLVELTPLIMPEVVA